MSEPIHVNGGPKPVAQVLITLLDNGQCTVNTNRPEKVFVYGLLELAREAVQSGFGKQPQPQSIIPIRGVIPNG